MIDIIYMVGIWQCHIPTPNHHVIFPPGGNMTGGNVLVSHADDAVLLHLLLPHVHAQLGTLFSAGAAEDTVTIINDDVSLTQSFPGRCLWRSRNQEQHCLGRQLWSLQGPSLGFKDMFGEDWFVTGCSLTHLIKFLSQRPPWYTWAIT